jgi:NAD(P)-dependent dehydrogenase (short-subunit alcohol dehydrogenase family)
MARTALVTGGTRGIGLGIAEALARDGFDLVLNGRRPLSDVSDTVEHLKSSGVEVLYVSADVSDERGLDTLVYAVKSEFGQLNVLVNNAGVAPLERKDILVMSPESYDRVMSINLRGPFLLTQAVANWMVDQTQSSPDFEGCIINIGSISATLASPERGEYCISKAGMSMATQLWAVRLAEFGIMVYEVRPGVTATDMTSGVKAKYDKMISDGLTLQPRWGTPEDVGKAVAALARGEFPYSTGQVVMVDGGLTVGRL